MESHRKNSTCSVSGNVLLLTVDVWVFFSSLSGMTVTVDHEELTNCCSPHNFTLHLSSLSPLISFFY